MLDKHRPTTMVIWVQLNSKQSHSGYNQGAPGGDGIYKMTECMLAGVDKGCQVSAGKGSKHSSKPAAACLPRPYFEG